MVTRHRQTVNHRRYSLKGHSRHTGTLGIHFNAGEVNLAQGTGGHGVDVVNFEGGDGGVVVRDRDVFQPKVHRIHRIDASTR